MPDEAAPARAPWTVTIDGRALPLRITADAAIGIEHATGRTLMQHAESVRGGGLKLQHLATILRYLVGPECPVAALRTAAPRDDIPAWALEQLGVSSPPAGLPQHAGDSAEAIIIRNGIIDVTARVMTPIVAALNAGADAAGNPR